MPEQVETTTESKVDVQKKRDAAQQHFKALKKTANLQRTSTMEIGWIARGMKAGGEFEILGMEEVQVMDAVGMERSTWFRAIQIAEGFKNLKKSEYLKLYSGKAYVGLKLPESDRYKPHWLARMCDPKLSTEEFEEIVAKKIEAGEVKQDATSVEDRDWFKVRLYKKDLEQCQQVLEDFCKEHDLGDNYGQALVVILTDKAQSRLSAPEIKMLFALKDAFKENMPTLIATIKLLGNAKRPAEERCTAFEKAGLEFVQKLSEAAGVKVKH